MIDVLFVNPDSSLDAYQDLAKTYSAIEPPTWALLLAQVLPRQGLCLPDPRLRRRAPVAGGVRAPHRRGPGAAGRLRHLRPEPQFRHDRHDRRHAARQGAEGGASRAPRSAFVGSHTSALPREVLAHPVVDIVLLNEGVYALHNLLASDLARRSEDHSRHRLQGARTAPAALQPCSIRPSASCRRTGWTSTCPAWPGTCCPIAKSRSTFIARISGMPDSTTPSARPSPRCTPRSAAISPAISA